MSKEQIFDYFYTNSADLGGKQMLIVMLAALFIGAVIFSTYFVCHRGTAYNAHFNQSVVVTLLVSTVIMLMISSNIILSLGMVGALSIVRFRTVIKDSRDMIFLFWAIAEGLSVGSLNFKLALVTTFFIALVLLGFNFMPVFIEKYLVVVTGDGNIDADGVRRTVEEHSKNGSLKSMTRGHDSTEFIFELRAKGGMRETLADELKKLPGVRTVSCVSESAESIA